MATELRRGARKPERGESPEPTHTGARPVMGTSRPATPSATPPSAAPWPESPKRAGRTSVRPSAFGIPRVSVRSSTRTPLTSDVHPLSPSDGTQVTETRPRSDAMLSGGPPPSLSWPTPSSEPPGASAPVSKRAVPDIIKADIEQLLPISQAVKSLPRPPRVPSFESQSSPLSSPVRRVPLASVGIFGLVLGASIAPLFRYSGLGSEPAPVVVEAAAQQDTAEPLASDESDVAEGAEEAVVPEASAGDARREAVERIERAHWGQPDKIRSALLEAGQRALTAGDERLAEALFAHAHGLDGESSHLAAFGLARVRLAQGDLEGAEGWVLDAIREHPRIAEYHALYAEVLERWGRHHDAQTERTLARALMRSPARAR